MYSIFKTCLKLILPVYCRTLHIDHKQLYKGDTPLILACNHPRGILDALIIAVCHPRKLYFMADGDAIKHVSWLMRWLRILPFYSNGNNSDFYSHCSNILAKGNSILVFPEGKAHKTNKIQAINKNTARLAQQAWRNNISVVVQPVCIKYGSISGRTAAEVTYAPTITRQQFSGVSEPSFFTDFNAMLSSSLKSCQ